MKTLYLTALLADKNKKIICEVCMTGRCKRVKAGVYQCISCKSIMSTEKESKKL